jgi:hypothetical protein
MKRTDFIKSLFFGGVAATTVVKSVKADTEPQSKIDLQKIQICKNTILENAKKIEKQFISKNESIDEKLYSDLRDSYYFLLEQCEEYGDEEITGCQFDKVSIRAMLQYHIIRKNISHANRSFSHIKRELEITTYGLVTMSDLCHWYKSYAEILLYYGYVNEAKSNIKMFMDYANEYALNKMDNKLIWKSVLNDSYTNNFQYKSNFTGRENWNPLVVTHINGIKNTSHPI